MAARYWVGGTGNWNDTARWSETSGGAGGASVPTSGDDVFFDSNSFTASSIVDIGSEVSCKSMDWSDINQSVIFRNNATNGIYTGYNINIYGSLTLSNLMTVTCGSRGFIYFRSTEAETITSNGLQMTLPGVYFDGIGGKWTLSDDLYTSSTDTSSGGQISFANGEFDVNGYTVTCRTIQLLNGTKTITFGSGTIKTNNFSNNFSGLTINAGTGTLQIGPFYRTSITSNSTITVYNLTILGVAQSIYFASAEFQMTTNIVVTNLLTIKGSGQGVNRLFISPGLNSSTVKRSFTAESVIVEYADFYDIIGLGNADWDLSAITGGAGDGGGNENITFTTPKTIYWFGNSGNYSDITKWFTATNGGGTPNQFPMIQDVMIFDENSISDDSTVTLDVTLLGQIDCLSVLHELSFLSSGLYTASLRLFGSLYFNNLCTLFNGSITLHGGGNYEIDISTNTIGSLSVLSRGTWSLINNLNIAQLMYLRNGTFDMNNYDVTTPNLQINAGTYYLRSGTLTLAGSTTSFQFGAGTFEGSNGTLINNPSAGSSNTTMYLKSGTIIKNVQLKGLSTGTVQLRFTGSTSAYCIFENVTIDAGRKLSIFQSQTVRVNTFVAIGSPDNNITLTAFVTSGSITSPFKLLNLSYNDITVEYCDISWSNVTGTTKIKTFMNKTWASIKSGIGVLKAGIGKIMGVAVESKWIANNSTDSGNNSGWQFNP